MSWVWSPGFFLCGVCTFPHTPKTSKMPCLQTKTSLAKDIYNINGICLVKFKHKYTLLSHSQICLQLNLLSKYGKKDAHKTQKHQPFVKNLLTNACNKHNQEKSNLFHWSRSQQTPKCRKQCFTPLAHLYFAVVTNTNWVRASQC